MLEAIFPRTIFCWNRLLQLFFNFSNRSFSSIESLNACFVYSLPFDLFPRQFCKRQSVSGESFKMSQRCHEQCIACGVEKLKLKFSNLFDQNLVKTLNDRFNCFSITRASCYLIGRWNGLRCRHRKNNYGVRPSECHPLWSALTLGCRHSEYFNTTNDFYITFQRRKVTMEHYVQ